MTDFRARGTIMGPTGLTAVFGMGTGVTPPVWSPEMPPAGGRARRGISSNRWSITLASQPTARAVVASVSPPVDPHGRGFVARGVLGVIAPPGGGAIGYGPPSDRSPRRLARATDRGGQAIGCWDRSAAAVARRPLPAHRPGRLPGAFIACANGNLVLKRASRLDAFSAYPFPT